MKLLTASQITHSYGDVDLFADLSVQINAKERIGLVGPNGCGKTTFLRILSGRLEPELGQVEQHTPFSIGYLQQEAVLTFADAENSIYAEMLSVFGDLTALEAEMATLEADMASGDFSADLMDRYGDAQAHYERLGGYDYQTEIKLVLLGLGFAEAMWQQPLTQLSGGQKTRLLLARLLLEKPDLLILDEPTNHLDVHAIEWLELTLRRYDGTLLIVSHDRYFLDNIVTHIWDMSPAQIKAYVGSYSHYVVQKQRDWQRENDLFQQERKRLVGELAYVRKHIAGGNRDIAKGKLRRLTRDLSLLEKVGVLGMQNKSWLEIGGRVRTLSPNEAANKLKYLVNPNRQPPRLNMKLDVAMRSDKMVLSTQEMRFGYATPLVSAPELVIQRGQRIALLGDNGSGKSTILKTLLGDIEPLKGRLKWGEQVNIGYFAQAHDQLNQKQRVIDELIDKVPMAQDKARRLLASYLFRGHDVFKKVGALSGGERGRLALAILAAQGANLLLLDEPTNHLDIPSQEVLQAVLDGYRGTMILVSHDRYLISYIANQLWIIEDGALTVYEGGYEAYVGRELPKVEPSPLDMPAPDPDSLDWIEDVEPAPELALETTNAPPADWRKRLGTLERDLDEVELQVNQLQMLIEDLSAFGATDELAAYKAELSVAEERLAKLSAEWDELVQ